MDTTDRNDSHLPARLPDSSSRLPAAFAARPTYELATTPASVQISPQGVLRGLVRNWWKILLIWAAVSGPLVYLLYVQVQPTYEAYSTIRTQPVDRDLYGSTLNSSGSADSLERYIETQREFILNDRVLKPALAEPAVARLDFVRKSDTPLQDLKKVLQVTNSRHTYFIRVLFESTDPREAATIVNAVVSTFLRAYGEYQEGTNAKLKQRLEDYLKQLEAAKNQNEEELLKIVDHGLVDTARLSAVAAVERSRKSNNDKNSSNAAPPVPATTDVTIEQYRDYKTRILDKKYELSMLEFELKRRLEEPQDQLGAEAGFGLAGKELDERVRDLFKRDPAIASLMDEIRATQAELEHNIGVARQRMDPARQAARRRLDQLMATYENVWNEQYEKIRQAVLAEAAEAAAAGPGAASPNALTVAELETRVKNVKQELTTLNDMLASMDVEKKATQSETYRAEQLKADIDSLKEQHDVVFKKLEDLKFTTDKDLFRVDLLHPADVLTAPTNNKRIKYMLVAPCAILCLVLGLFALLEVKAERVADPDSLSTRVQSEVFSLPPLPMARAANKLSGPGDDDQIDRFIQRLDHLRFAVCGDNPEVGLGRCVLITSAIGGEGKTTLAAQLAARCGHAAHTTLLIDADLRRGSLCPLLDVPEGLGLSDVLKDEANVEDVVIPVQGGTFHLLSAGTPVADASRLFQGRNFGMLIARLRQMYDLIIIDSPPVLPVPDGLILGRWTDGAVLASRYDVSRAPQVERARRQLNNAGIPVLGTVINGMRSSDSYYGRYSYSRGRSGSGDHDEAAAPVS